MCRDAASERNETKFGTLSVLIDVITCAEFHLPRSPSLHAAAPQNLPRKVAFTRPLATAEVVIENLQDSGRELPFATIGDPLRPLLSSSGDSMRSL